MPAYVCVWRFCHPQPLFVYMHLSLHACIIIHTHTHTHTHAERRYAHVQRHSHAQPRALHDCKMACAMSHVWTVCISVYAVNTPITLCHVGIVHANQQINTHITHTCGNIPVQAFAHITAQRCDAVHYCNAMCFCPRKHSSPCCGTCVQVN